MAIFMNFLLKVPFRIRVMVFLFIMVVLWRFLGKGILMLFSVIPFLLRKIFFLLYQIMEIPIIMLHKKFGVMLYNIDNSMSMMGKKIDTFLGKWYQYWRYKYKFKWGKMLIVYLVCLSFIIAPSVVSFENDLFKKGEELYLSMETSLIERMRSHIEHDSIQETVVTEEEKEIDQEETEISQIKLIVAGVNSSLLVRDIPDMEDGTALERLHNGDVVIWTGEMVFAEAKDNHIEAWAKVVTQNEVEGWSRLFYLHPQNYENISYHVEE